MHSVSPLPRVRAGASYTVTDGCCGPAHCIAAPPRSYYNVQMKTLTVRLPEALVAEIEAESRGRKLSKSDVVRERLTRAPRSGRGRVAPLNAIADLIGSVDGLPADLSARTKHYLRRTRYGQKRPR